jgi:hypothetical protein
MSVAVTYEKQTHNGLFRNTERTWVASNGHTVKVITKQNIACKTTWAGRNAAFAEVAYVCECGREFSTQGNPKKSALDAHDSWFTKSERKELVARMMEAFKN